MSMTIRDKVFISYSHHDKEWLSKIKTQLKPLVRTDPILFWDDTKIEAGSNWKEEIAKALESAKVALLLVSPDFLASDFVDEHELPGILQAADKEGLIILWIAVSFCSKKSLEEIEKYQAINNPDEPLDRLSSGDQNVVLAKLRDDVQTAMEKHLYAKLPDEDNHLGPAISGF